AEAALARLLLDERALQGMELLDGAETLDGRDAPLDRRRNGCDARAHVLAVDQHRARATLREPAAELRPVQLEVVAEDIEQRRVCVDRDRPPLTVDAQRET